MRLTRLAGIHVLAGLLACVTTSCHVLRILQNPYVGGAACDIDIRPLDPVFHYIPFEHEYDHEPGNSRDDRLIIHVTPNSNADGTIGPTALGDDEGANIDFGTNDYEYFPWRCEFELTADRKHVVLTLYQRSMNAPSQVGSAQMLETTRTPFPMPVNWKVPRQAYSTANAQVFEAAIDGVFFRFSLTGDEAKETPPL